MKKFFILTLTLALMAPAITYSEFIINDKFAWTNIRKEPGAKVVQTEATKSEIRPATRGQPGDV